MEKSFGYYLLQKGLLERDQLLRALKHLREVIATPEMLALEEGLMTPDMIRHIKAAAEQSGRSFLEVATAAGFLTEEHKARFARVRAGDAMYLSRAISDLGFLSEERVRKEVEEFMAKQLREGMLDKLVVDTLERSKKLPSEAAPEKDIVKLLATEMGEQLEAIAKMSYRLGDFGITQDSIDNFGMVVFLDAKLDHHVILFLTLEEGIAKRIVESMVKFLEAVGVFTSEATSIVFNDCIGEFFNIVCGHTSAELLKAGKRMKIFTPKVERIEGKSKIVLGHGSIAVFASLWTTHGNGILGLIKSVANANYTV